MTIEPLRVVGQPLARVDGAAKVTGSAAYTGDLRIPGLEHAEFVRLGSLHRNTFINSPRTLARTLDVLGSPGLAVAGQLVGVEGYVESTATGLLAGVNAARAVHGLAPVAPRLR